MCKSTCVSVRGGCVCVSCVLNKFMCVTGVCAACFMQCYCVCLPHMVCVQFLFYFCALAVWCAAVLCVNPLMRSTRVLFST